MTRDGPGIVLPCSSSEHHHLHLQRSRRIRASLRARERWCLKTLLEHTRLSLPITPAKLRRADIALSVSGSSLDPNFTHYTVQLYRHGKPLGPPRRERPF